MPMGTIVSIIAHISGWMEEGSKWMAFTSDPYLLMWQELGQLQLRAKVYIAVSLGSVFNCFNDLC